MSQPLWHTQNDLPAKARAGAIELLNHHAQAKD